MEARTEGSSGTPPCESVNFPQLGWGTSGSRYGFASTETCERLSLVNASRIQPLHRSHNAIPAMRAIRSSCDGQT
jgi:hypothetical protein